MPVAKRASGYPSKAEITRVLTAAQALGFSVGAFEVSRGGLVRVFLDTSATDASQAFDK
jgi:hypothetical protein